MYSRFVMRQEPISPTFYTQLKTVVELRYTFKFSLKIKGIKMCAYLKHKKISKYVELW